jgi:MFS family permease
MNLPINFHYFSRKINREVREVYWFSAINGLAIALIFLFEPIYLYQIGYSLTQIMWFYLMVYVWYVILIFPAVRLSSRMGYKHSIFISSIFYILYWLVLYHVRHYSELFFVAPALFALQKGFFWPAFDADVSLASIRQQRGREIGALLSEIEIVSIIGPLIGGVISTVFGFSSLFTISAVLMIAAVYPLFKTPDVYTRHEFKFSHFKKIFKNFLPNFFGYWGYAEDLMLISLWPLAIYLAVDRFVGVGFISTFAGLVATVLMLYIGKLSDRIEKRRLILVTSIIYGLSWIFRAFGRGVAGVIAYDTITKTAKASVNVPVVSLTYENAAGQGPDYAVAHSVFYEFSLSIGKIVVSVAAIIILSKTNDPYAVFALVGLMTIMYGLLRNK